MEVSAVNLNTRVFKPVCATETVQYLAVNDIVGCGTAVIKFWTWGRCNGGRSLAPRCAALWCRGYHSVQFISSRAV